MTTIERLRALLAEATPGPWQQSRFVDHPQYAHMDVDWKTARRGDEARLIRGPGIVGRPECNQIAGARQPEDAALIVVAVNALPALLDERDALREALVTIEADAPSILGWSAEDHRIRDVRVARAALDRLAGAS